MGDLRIVFMGTPDFAVATLDSLVNAGHDIVSIITAPDKAAGRGKKIRQSEIKNYALAKAIPILQPTNLKDPQFINQLRHLNANLQIVVAFRMLPEVIWSMPKFGTFNLHASLLPQYRGAAPINWAIINGENETGVTSFFINHEIDTGKIILQEKTPISKTETTGELHDRLKKLGADLVLKTVQLIQSGNLKLHEQIITEENKTLKNAPKIFKADGKINWGNSSQSINNLIRGLSPHPGAYTNIKSPNSNSIQLKIFRARVEIDKSKAQIGSIQTDGKSYFKIKCADGFIYPQEIQLAGKNKMKSDALLRGFSMNNEWIIV